MTVSESSTHEMLKVNRMVLMAVVKRSKIRLDRLLVRSVTVVGSKVSEV